MPAPFSGHDDECSRRAMITRMVGAALGVSIADTTRVDDAVKADTERRAPAAIITLHMGGGMSQLDTFDPKPGRAEQGSTGVIRTSIPGIVFAERLPRLAAMADRLAVIRTVGTQTGDHNQATYLLRTGYEMINTIRHPSTGSWVLHATHYEGELPGFVFVGDGNTHPGCGFLDARLSPVSVNDPARGLVHAQRPRHLPEPLLNRRLAIAERIDQSFKERYQDRIVDAYDSIYAEAVKLIGSSQLKAFDISREPPNVHERYGETLLGKGCILARRLVEAGVRVVDIDSGGWDLHGDMYLPSALPALTSTLDQSVTALLEDLDARGLLQSTLVVIETEFGRTPTINTIAGRDHHPAVFSCVLAGAGIKPGVVYGESDERAHFPESGAVSVADFATTVAAAAGLPYDRPFNAPNGRPFKIGGGGTPVREVLA